MIGENRFLNYVLINFFILTDIGNKFSLEVF